jgi:hypothetical protein
MSRSTGENRAATAPPARIWVLPEAFRSRVIASTMLPQSDEFRKPMTRSTLCYIETNVLTAAAAAFRRPSPPFERLQLGGNRKFVIGP